MFKKWIRRVFVPYKKESDELKPIVSDWKKWNQTSIDKDHI